MLISNACETVVATAVAECKDCRHIGLETLKPPSELVSKGSHSNVAGMVQLCLKSGPAFSPQNFYFVCWSAQTSDRVPLSFILAVASRALHSVTAGVIAELQREDRGESCSKGFSDRAPKAVRNTQMDVRTLSQSSLSFLKAAFCRFPPLCPLHSPPASCVCNSKYGSSNRQSGAALVMCTREILLLLSTD